MALHNKDPHRMMLAARTALVLDQPFFGALALRLELKEDPTCKTAWVDGRTLGYNPDFVGGLTHDERVGLTAHEVMHCAMGHPWRRAGRAPGKWNVACDYSVNDVLLGSGFKLPEGGLYDATFAGRWAEWVFDRLPDGDGQDDASGTAAPAGDQGDGQPQGGGQPGEVRDAPADAHEDGMTEADWKEAVQQAATAAKRRGSLPGGLERFAAAAAAPRVEWRSVLWRFAQDVARADYSWARPNRRYIPQGLYLPSLESHEMGEIVWGFDTSGSVDEVLVGQFAREIQAVAEDLQPARVHVVYCDRKVQGVDTFERGEPIVLKPLGGGGTGFAPVFEKVEELGIVPACLVYLTDMQGSFPDDAPDYPVLWATTSDDEAPFGEKVRCG